MVLHFRTMKCLAIIFFSYLAIHSGTSSSLPGRNTDGETNDCSKRLNELTTIAEANANVIRKSLQGIQQRIGSSDNIQTNITEILTSFTEAQSNIEMFLSELRNVLNAAKNLDSEGTTASPFQPNLFRFDVEDLEENHTTAPSHVTIAGAMEMKFDDVYKGRKTALSSDFRTAKRSDPLEDFAHAGVTTKDYLKEDELFQIRIEETMDKWTEWGFAMGLVRDKISVGGAWTITHEINGTWVVWSAAYSSSGKAAVSIDKQMKEDGYPLDTRGLPVGTVLGVKRRSNGDVHYYLDGVDKGVAFTGVPKDVYVFVDLIFYLTKISIVN